MSTSESNQKLFRENVNLGRENKQLRNEIDRLKAKIYRMEQEIGNHRRKACDPDLAPLGGCTIVRFDGGTPCNDPKKGYGKGYGSYTIDGNEPVRCHYNVPMSNNCAELTTARMALEAVPDPEKPVVVIGDSQIALKWVENAFRNSPVKVSKGSSDAFRDSIVQIYEVAKRFKSIRTQWKPRARMVEVFGH